jgi:hypothetical protein
MLDANFPVLLSSFPLDSCPVFTFFFLSPTASPLAGGLPTSLLSLPPLLLTKPSPLSPSPLSPSEDLPTTLVSSPTSLPLLLFLFSYRTLSLTSPMLVSLLIGTSSPKLLSPTPLDYCPIFTFFFLSPTASPLTGGLPT